MTFDEVLRLPYKEYVQLLKDKYGEAEYDYFRTPDCKSKNPKLSRTQEGLFCHHVAENKEILLSTPEVARTHPFEYQQAHNLVYANYIEHLLLHIKIVEEDIENRGVGLGGVIMISGALNDYYRHKRADGWRKFAMDKIKNNYADYINIMKYFKDLVDSDNVLSKLIPSPILAQGWYGRINQKAHVDVYGFKYTGDIAWSNSDLLLYLENSHNNTK